MLDFIHRRFIIDSVLIFLFLYVFCRLYYFIFYVFFFQSGIELFSKQLNIFSIASRECLLTVAFNLL